MTLGSNIRKGSVLVICATVCWGLISPLAKIISAADIDLMTLMVFRSLFTIAVSLLCLFLVGNPARLRVDRETLCFYFLCGFFSIALAGGCYLKSLSYLTVAQALVIHYTSPLVTLAGSMWITRAMTFLRKVRKFFSIPHLCCASFRSDSEWGGRPKLLMIGAV